MELKLEIYGCLCSTSEFIINDVDADYEDFGTKYDNYEENAEEYGCGDMIFKPKKATQNILNKYNINIDEYNTVCEQLEEGLSFGKCGWCI